jgi:DNA-binding NtrC family response regulator
MFICEVLSRLGFETIAAGCVRDARDAAAKLATFDLAVIDIGLPDENGLDFAAELAAQRPGLKVIIVSGYAEIAQHLSSLDPRLYFLTKPFDEREFVHSLLQLGF